ncbi:SLC13 family permease [Rubeoparvulum massiliense]|uniref:SLC13 family permease n=1 Tax=Rubeoparvulum massiliense TaxID=1631346 RepID=UPI00065DD827|nr:SLC13 family permease [Rubeoparvulum massiliense]
MHDQMILVFIIIIIMVVLFMSNRLRADFVALSALVTLILTGIITPQEALAGFSNTAVIMIAALFVVGAGIFRTGLAKAIGQKIIQLGGQNERRLLVIVMLVVASFSAFMSNTGTVAVLMPIMVSLAMGIGRAPGRFLLPMAFASSLGGVLTLIGTPPNLIVNQTLQQFGYERLGFFDFTPVALAGVIVGIFYMATIGQRLLPHGSKSKRALEKPSEEQSRSSAHTYLQLSAFIHVAKVLPTSSILNQELHELQMTQRFDLTILEIMGKSQNGKIITNTYDKLAGPHTVLQPGDLLYIFGNPMQFQLFVETFGLKAMDRESQQLGEQNHLIHLVNKQFGIAEVILVPSSTFIHHSLKETRFRERYQLNVLAINRRGEYLTHKVGDESLRFGDTLLVQGSWESLETLQADQHQFVVVGRPSELASTAKASGKAPIAALIMIAMLIVMTLEIIAPVTAVIIAALAMIITGCLRNMDEAYGSINWESVILIAAMLPIATALDKTGGVQFVAQWLIQVIGSYGPFAVLAGFYLLTTLFSQFISNTATAVIFAPVALTTAVQMGVSPYPFLLCVSLAASMAFSTPVASPPNAMVMTAGGYRFTDYMKVGIPLQLILAVVTIFILPFFFPF